MKSLDNKIQTFRRRYSAEISPSSRRFHRSVPVRDFFEEDYYNSLPMESIPGVQIEMPEDRFRTLIDMEDTLNKWDSESRLMGSKYIDYITHLYEKEFRDSVLREQHPALKKAYEHYMIMLAMASAGDLK